MHFDCYALALPTGLGIAVAAALGLAKVAIVSITIFVKVTEGYLKMTKSPLRNCISGGVVNCHMEIKSMTVCFSIVLLLTVVG